MARVALALGGLAVVVALAVLALTGTFSGPSTAAPACLPSTLEHSARLAGTSIDVSPAPNTDTANPGTQISLLGMPATSIRHISVLGQRSGSHSGRLEPYSQGDGASFVPSSAFDPGEQVDVRVAGGRVAGEREWAAVYHFRVDTPFSTADIGPFPNPPAAAADYQSFATLPGVQAPILHVTAPDRDPRAGDVFTSNGPSAGRYGPLIYTPQGRLVWFEQLPGGESAENLSVQEYEGARDLSFWQGKVLSLGFGEGEDVILNDGYQTVAKVKGGNGLQADLHDFQLAPRAVAYVTAFNPIRCDVSSVESGTRNGVILDNAIQQIDVKTGLVRWEWHSLDHVAASESETASPKTSAPWDWFHLNSIDLEPNGDILISARSTWAAYQIEKGSGEILWRLGGNRSSFAMGPGTKTAWQHDARVLRSGEVTLFDDGSNPPVHAQSRGVRIALDTAKHRARLTAAYLHPQPPLLAASQGNMQTLPDGNSVVDYGGVPDVAEYARDGSLLFDAHLSFDMSTYRAFRYPWSAQPTYPPSAATSLNNTGEQTIVRASWNGATDVAAWRALAGPSPRHLKRVERFADSDFESEAILSKRYAYIAVQALDARGRVLATSRPAQVGPYGQ